MTSFSYANGPASQVATNLLIVPAFKGATKGAAKDATEPEPGPGTASLGVMQAYAAARLEGARGEDLLIAGPGASFAAGAVLVLGMGVRAELTLDGARRAMGRAAATARRFGRVATTVAQALPARHAAESVGAVAEALALGAYRFDRYRSKPEEGGLDAVIVLGADRWDAKTMRASLKRTAISVERLGRYLPDRR